MNYTLHPGAELDVDEACRRYRKNASGLVVLRFLDEFDRVARLLADQPGLGTPTGGGRSSFRCNGFPTASFSELPARAFGCLLFAINTETPGTVKRAVDVTLNPRSPFNEDRPSRHRLRGPFQRRAAGPAQPSSGAGHRAPEGGTESGRVILKPAGCKSTTAGHRPASASCP